MPLLIAFLLVPLVEIGLFIQIGGFIGLWPTLAIVVVTAIVGAKLVQHQGSGVLARLQSSFQDLRDPSEPLAEGAMILFSGALLLTPGFFTDAVGLSLMVPQVRQLLFDAVRSRMATMTLNVGAAAQHPRAADDVIDGEFEEVRETPPRANPPSNWTKH